MTLVSRFICFLLSSVALGQAQDFQKKKPPADPFSRPDFQALVRKADPLDAVESLKLFDVPDGFRMELVAASPDIGQPMNLAFDERGRLWVTSTLEYPFAVPLDQVGRDTIKVMAIITGVGGKELNEYNVSADKLGEALKLTRKKQKRGGTSSGFQRFD